MPVFQKTIKDVELDPVYVHTLYFQAYLCLLNVPLMQTVKQLKVYLVSL